MICTAAERWFVPRKSSGGHSGGLITHQASNSNNSNANSSSNVSNNSNSSSNTTKPGPSHSHEVDYDQETLQSLVHHCLTKCDNDVKKDLLANIVIVGGGSLIDGVSNRLTYELNELVPTNMKVIATYKASY
jgi:actin-related protein